MEHAAPVSGGETKCPQGRIIRVKVPGGDCQDITPGVESGGPLLELVSEGLWVLVNNHDRKY